MLKLENISLHYGELNLFDQMNLQIDQPGLYCITGRSGCGKTTLLNIIAGYEKNYTGDVEISHDLKKGFIFQTFELIPELDVKENLALSGLANPISDDDILQMAKKLQIDSILDHEADEISYGQKQRVAIARTLLAKPNLILCDEPTESLNRQNKEIVMDVLKELSKDSIVIVVCHDSNIVDRYGDVVYEIMDNNLIKKVDQLKNGNILRILQKRIDTLKMMKTMFRINLHHKFYYATSIILVFIVSIVFTLYISVKQYQIPMDRNVLNYDTLYTDIGLIGHSKLLDGDQFYKVPSISDFLILENKQYKTIASPLFELSGKNIYISQKLAETLSENTDELIGKEVNIQYKINNLIKTETVVIEGIVETDASYKSSHFYYSYDYYTELCEGYCNGGMIILNKDSYLVDSYSYYSKLSYNLSNPYLEYCSYKQQQFRYIQYILFMLFSLFFISGTTYMMYLTGNFEKKQKKNMLIMQAIDVPDGIIQSKYYSTRLLLTLLSIILSGVLHKITSNIMIHRLGWTFITLKYDYIIYIFYVCIIVLSIWINARKDAVKIMKSKL